MIKAIFFDLGETLVHYGRVNVTQMLREAAEVTYAFLQQRQENGPLPHLEHYCRQTARAVKIRYVWSHLTNREFQAVPLLKATLERLGVRVSPTELEELAWLWYQPLARRAWVEQGLAQSLAALQERGLKMGIISNTFCPGTVLDRQLARFGLLEYFPVRVYSCDTIHRKPDPRIFRRALGALDVQGRDSVMVGDSVRPDIRGGLRMGMRPVLKLGELNASARVGPKVPTIRSIGELADIIDRWNAG